MAGGGVALIRVLQKIANLEGDNSDQTVGVGIALRAMEAPLRQIVENAGEEGSVVVDKVKQGTGNFGYNAGNRRIRRYDRHGYSGSSQGDTHGSTGCGIYCWFDDHHRSYGC